MEEQKKQESQAVALKDVEREDDAESGGLIDFKMVTFSLSGKDYGIDIMGVKEIAEVNRFTYVPNTLPFVLGVHNLRGDIIPILDLRLFFNIPIPQSNGEKMESLIILTVEDHTFGVVVDKIDKVVGVQKTKISPPHPLFGDINIKYISGVVEANSRLYVLLDIDKIFNSRVDTKEDKQPSYSIENSPMSAAPSAAMEMAGAGDAQEIKFISEALASYRHFHVSSINEKWVASRFSSWRAERGAGAAQLQNEQDADAFLAGFWSPFTGAWWSQQYADEVYKLLPDNSAKQICVWNPGCGKGQETYSLACVLARRYPGAKVRIYAQDIDLLNVSNAPLMSVPEDVASGWYSPWLSKKANGEATFSQALKDSIMFEYHDCANTNALPDIDIVFARDILSLLDDKGRDAVFADIDEKVKGNGVVILGQNERMAQSQRFTETESGSLRVYSKK